MRDEVDGGQNTQGQRTHAIEVPTQRIDLEKVNPDRNVVDGKRAVCSHDSFVPVAKNKFLVSRKFRNSSM